MKLSIVICCCPDAISERLEVSQARRRGSCGRPPHFAGPGCPYLAHLCILVGPRGAGVDGQQDLDSDRGRQDMGSANETSESIVIMSRERNQFGILRGAAPRKYFGHIVTCTL